VKPLILTALVLLGSGAGVLADARSKAATEAAEYVLQKFGRKAVSGGVTALSRQIELSAAKHGPAVLGAVRRIGPRALPLCERAGAHGSKAARILSSHGEAGAVWVVSRPGAMKIVATHGEGAAVALVKHAGLAEPVIGKFGAPAIRALEKVGPQGGRRLAMLAADGHLAKIGRTPELLEVIAKYGERAASFIWANKGALMTAAALSAFLADPEKFLDGAAKITGAVGDAVVKPALESVVKPVVGGVFRLLYVLLALAGVVLVALGAIAYRFGPPNAALLNALLHRKAAP
jgi:hypothetical protein